jgi:excinuclease ABC subunit C
MPINPAFTTLYSKIPSLPSSPGVYQFRDLKGGIIYIGKAKNLKARVRQYFTGHDERPQIPFLMREAADLDYTVVPTELESLYLERTLIQKHKPKYNIDLRDDKNYAFIAFDYQTPIPQITITRQITSSPAFRSPTTNYLLPTTNNYFGPYSAAYKAREILKTIRYIFPFCSATKVSNKPCFYYHLHRCPGVCVGVISVNEYMHHLAKIKLFLKGDIKGVRKDLEKEMRAASAARLYEKAARVRNQISALDAIAQKQSAILPKKVSWDVIALAAQDGYWCVNLFKVREGKLTDKENFIYQSSPSISNIPQDFQQLEILQKFLEDYYSETSDRPDKIYLETETENASLITALLRARFNKKTTVSRATQNQPLQLLKTSKQNAQEYLKRTLDQKASEFDRINSGLTQLKEILKLPALPKRIECYDISNIQGTNAVGSMVVFIDGKPAKSQYRKFKIRSKDTPDDFTMMKEMLSRRLTRSKNQEAGIKDVWPVPDLIVIDGGRGQLSSVVSIIHDSHFMLHVPIIGLAKRIEEIFLPNSSNPIILPHDQPALQMLQRLRDEAHRFGITYHRALRSKQAVKSALDEIPGIGPKTKKLLKQKFGTVKNIKNSSVDELISVVGKKLSETIRTHLA